jgi:hypothetical protein
MPPVDHDALLDRALRQLPSPRAPHTFLPRVLAAARAWAERPWYRRAWLTWPIGWQAASAGALAGVVACALWLMPQADVFIDQAMPELPLASLSPALHIVSRIRQVATACAAVGDAVWVVWRALMLPGVLYGYGLLALTAAVWLACGATLNRFSYGKALSR